VRAKRQSLLPLHTHTQYLLIPLYASSHFTDADQSIAPRTTTAGEVQIPSSKVELDLVVLGLMHLVEAFESVFPRPLHSPN
jgi:hypothetical protein